jgi:hypothetical protein
MEPNDPAVTVLAETAPEKIPPEPAESEDPTAHSLPTLKPRETLRGPLNTLASPTDNDLLIPKLLLHAASAFIVRIPANWTSPRTLIPAPVKI